MGLMGVIVDVYGNALTELKIVWFMTNSPKRPFTFWVTRSRHAVKNSRQPDLTDIRHDVILRPTTDCMKHLCSPSTARGT